MILNNMFLMKRLVFVAVVAAVFFGVSTVTCNAQDEKKGPVVYSNTDRESIGKAFSETQDSFVKAVTGLSDAQLNFSPNEKSWTVAQVAEHIVISETAMRGMIDGGVLKAPLNKDAGVFRMSDLAVILTVTNRNQKFNAPTIVQPKENTMSVTDLLNGFKTARKENMDFLASTKIDLRNHFAANPLFGMPDAYQWFLFLNYHTERHLAQMAEIKAHKDYPIK